MNENDFSSIEPYTDEQIPEAIERLAANPMFERWVKTINPRVSVSFLVELCGQVSSCDQFQAKVMRWIMGEIISRSMTKFDYSGLEYLSNDRPCVLVSNHRDITLDAALLDIAMIDNGLTTPEIGFGNNLMKNQMIADIFRLNKMFTIIRDGTKREFYRNSVFLSSYIHHVIENKHESVWIAQRNGRTKDGNDMTEQGLVKMFAMSGTGDFEHCFNGLHIVPVAMSYEYEPCDAMKIIEMFISATGLYEKSSNEDLISIMHGIVQSKGHVHCSVCEPISENEVAMCAQLNGNERFNRLAQIIDHRIHAGYMLHKTNYIAADLLSGTANYEHYYSTEDMENFIAYVDREIHRGPSDAAQEKLNDMFIEMYAYPLINKEKLQNNQCN